MSIRPLEGKALIQMFEPEKVTQSGLLEIPGIHNPTLVKGRVRAIGPWRKAKNGMRHLPEFAVNDVVIVRATTGQKLSGNQRVVRQDEVLALCTGEHETVKADPKWNPYGKFMTPR